jgi:PDZ domain-containing secreted protein
VRDTEHDLIVARSHAWRSSGSPSQSRTLRIDNQPESVSTSLDVTQGQLGLILETSKKGFPTVLEIKPTSPFMFEVEVGDKLCNVDGVDVNVSDPESVLRLMKSKNNGGNRKFVFARPQKKK